MKILGYDISLNKIQNATPTQSQALPEKSNIFRTQVKYQQTLSRTRQDIATYRSALQSAESITYPNRTELYRLYKDIVMDAHLASLIDTRKKAILASSFIVTKNGKEKLEKTEFLQKKWFYDFTNLAMDSIFWGHSLIQFGDFVNDEFTNLSLVPREYVKPEFNVVVSNPSLMTGVSYLETPFKEWVIGVGDRNCLGLLSQAAPLVLWKKNALAGWANYIELISIPIRIGKTDTRDEKTRANMEEMLKTMGQAAYGIFDLEDTIELIESRNTSPYEIFDKMIERCNSELAKLILGQTSTSDQKSYVGAANVHERVMHQVNEADEIFIENIFTYQLVPFLNMHGLGFNNLKIESEADDELTLQDKAKIDIELLKFYEIPAEYILETYGTPVIPRTISPKTTDTLDDSKITDVTNKLSDYYGDSKL
ncbi:MAG: hypothetical protein K0S53_390 [Bacteroidetes bacterium]|jgi:phage gp29-like protein|nr:hypothetical protein [Bacteroidota bacterium]